MLSTNCLQLPIDSIQILYVDFVINSQIQFKKSMNRLNCAIFGLARIIVNEIEKRDAINCGVITNKLPKVNPTSCLAKR